MRRWAAPGASAPIKATVVVPGSKSETNRALVLAALASGPSTITGGLEARDTTLMRDALRALGVRIEESDQGWRVIPPDVFHAGATVDCGLAGTVMRFVPPLAALADGTTRFTGDVQAHARPMGPLLAGLRAFGALVTAGEAGAADGSGAAASRRDGSGAGPHGHDTLPFAVSGGTHVRGGPVTFDASGSSQFVSGLLLAGARFPDGIEIRHVGSSMPSLPHIQMTVTMLRQRGVRVDDRVPDRWIVAPGPIAPQDVTIEPDLSNAAPFLAAAAITGGTVTVPHWPERTHQPGAEIGDILRRFGARVAQHDGALTVQGTDHLHGVDLDLRAASELTPVIAAVAALADHTSHLRGIGHVRGHETDRLAALETELNRLGSHVSQTHDGLTIHPRLLGGDLWRTYADHRMAQAGALLGLVVPEVELDDIDCTAKTMPEFERLWTTMIEDSAAGNATS